MPRSEQEFMDLVLVEQRLLNAAGELRAAERRLTQPSLLKEQIGRLLLDLGATVELTRQAKHIALDEWKAAVDTRAA